jgi:hypothetical protein
MMFLKKSSLNQGIHAHLIGKVNTTVAHFVVDSLAMLLLFDLYIYHNANVSPAPCVMPMEITFMDNGGNIFILCEFIDYMNSLII